jgi:hypothetical protein
MEIITEFEIALRYCLYIRGLHLGALDPFSAVRGLFTDTQYSDPFFMSSMFLHAHNLFQSELCQLAFNFSTFKSIHFIFL